MGNIAVKNGIAVSGDKCTMCYRCISKCPEQVITLLGKKVIEQNDVSRYL
jgi:ferredoxin